MIFNILITLIFIMGLTFIPGCKRENPLSVDTDLPKDKGAGNLPYVVSISPSEKGELRDDNPDSLGIQAEVIVAFSDFMDSTTISPANVKVINTSTGDSVPGLNIFYNKEARRLYISNKDWAGSSAYLLILVSDRIKNSFGVPLDGDKDGRQDGSPYDDFLSTFYTLRSSSESCVPIRQPRVTSIAPDTIRITHPKPYITVTFSTKMDTTTLTAANFKLTEEMQTRLIDRVSFTPFSVTFTPRESLQLKTKYTFTLKSNQIKADYPRHTLDYLRVLDADYDGSEETEPDFSWYFLYDTIAPPRVTHYLQIPNGYRIDFSKRMEPATLTNAHIKIFDNEGYIAGSLVIQHPPPGTYTRVEYYFQRPINPPFRIFVSKDVKSLDGRFLDSNNNGIGGEIGDDFWR